MKLFQWLAMFMSLYTWYLKSARGTSCTLNFTHIHHVLGDLITSSSYVGLRTNTLLLATN